MCIRDSMYILYKFLDMICSHFFAFTVKLTSCDMPISSSHWSASPSLSFPSLSDSVLLLGVIGILSHFASALSCKLHGVLNSIPKDKRIFILLILYTPY